MVSEAEAKLIRYCNTLYTEGSEYREQHSQRWKRSIELMKGDYWPKKRPSYKVNAVMNFLAQNVERKAALLTDSRPTITVSARYKGLAPACEILKKTIEGIFEERSIEQKLAEFVFLEQYFGFGVFNTCWDRSLDFGMGDTDIVPIDPRCCVFDPFVSRSYNLAYGEYFCLETVRPTEMLKDLYPKRADDIKADFGSDEAINKDSFVAKVRALFKRETDSGSNVRKESVIPRSIGREFWVRDRQTREGKKVFPTWRVIRIGGGCILNLTEEEQVNPYWDGQLPFDGMEWGFDVDSAYGKSETSILEMPQTMFNKVLATVIENAILTGNNIWIGDQNALSAEGWQKLSNEPGSHVPKRPGKELTRLSPPALPNYINQLLSMLLLGMEKLSGLTEVTEGRRPGQVTSGAALETLAIAAQTLIRLKARQLESVLTRVGQKLISRIFEYYTKDRMFDLVGNDGHFEQYLFVRAELEKIVKEAGRNMSTAFSDFKFKVVPASSLALTKWQKGLIAAQLFQLGAIDREEVLKSMEWPNWEEVLERTIEGQMSGQEPVGASKGQKLSRSMLRGGGRELSMQRPISSGQAGR